MMVPITVVVTNYLRPASVARLIDALTTQTVKATIFVWDNSPTQDFDDHRVDWIIRSSKNARCSARWWMASHAVTDFVLIHDDDLMPSHPKVLAWTLEAATRAAPFALGAAGVILKRNAGYWQSRHVGIRAERIRHDLRVDIVKGCYFCSPTVQLTRIGYLDLDGEDDIAVSAKLRGGVTRPHMVAAGLQTSLALLEEGEGARKHRRHHRAAREAARRRFFSSV
jgi:hypothetical protein